MQTVTSLQNKVTPISVVAFGAMTWFFSAMQCNKESCYTTDNPILQVIFAGAVAATAIAVVTSAPVMNQLQKASAFFKSKSATETTAAPDNATKNNELFEDKPKTPRAESPMLFSPTNSNSSTQAQAASEPSNSRPSTPQEEAGTPKAAA